MPDPLPNIRTALVGMSDTELAAVHIAPEETAAGPESSGLLAAIAHACDWELHRRRGIDFALQGPQEAIGPEHVAENLTALALFGTVSHTQPRVQALLDAISEALQAARPAMQ